MVRRLVAWLTAGLCVALAMAAEAEVDPGETLRAALNASDQGVALGRRDPLGAAEQYRAAADGFTKLRREGFGSAALFYNLGNVHFRLGETGKAIAYYLRAAAIEPGNRLVRANLDYARQRVEPQIAAGDEGELIERVLFWQYGTTRRTRLWAAALFGTAGWLALAVWVRWRVRGLVPVALIGIALGLSNAGLLAWELRQQSRTPTGVVVGDAYVLRLGRGEGHDAALSEPLGPGVEVTVRQRRGDWYEVQLVDGTRGWLPGRGVQLVGAL